MDTNDQAEFKSFIHDFLDDSFDESADDHYLTSFRVFGNDQSTYARQESEQHLFLLEKSHYLHFYFSYNKQHDAKPHHLTLQRVMTSESVTAEIAFPEGRDYECYTSIDTSKLYTEENPLDKQQVDELQVKISDAEGNTLEECNSYWMLGGGALDHVELTNICLLRSEDSEEAFSDVDQSLTYIQFRREDLAQIFVASLFEPRTQLPTEFFRVNVALYDDMGRLLQFENREASYAENEGCDYQFLTVSLGSFSDYHWEQGSYRIEVSWCREVMASLMFTVAEKDLLGDFDINAIQPKVDRGSRKIVQGVKNAQEKLDAMIGMKKIKERIASLRQMSRLKQQRQRVGLPTQEIPLHALFIGNAGTGKSTIVELIGQLYHEMGLLSKGHVVYEERRTLIGRYYDSELRETERALRNAQGGILFIDHAPTLNVKDDPKDPGHKVLESLLIAMEDRDKRDWMLVLAGYPNEMDKMLNSNPGLRSCFNETFYFEDFKVDELMQIADLHCRQNKYLMTEEARLNLESLVTRDYNTRDESFGNGRYIKQLLEQKIIPHMGLRLLNVETPTIAQLQTITEEDIPSLRRSESSRGLEQLREMVGLTSLKTSIESHLDFVKMTNLRMQQGIHTSMPPLHMVFMGNPGTGKTTVAGYMGEIYASFGILSHGEVIHVEKSDLVGDHIGETEAKVRAVLSRARGNVLFIDEAYQLWSAKDDHDFGRIVVESLLTTLSNEYVDMIVILAGYTHEMDRLLEMNPGLKSRFPYVFHFEDYTADELLKIGKYSVRRQGFAMTEEAEKLLRAIILKQTRQKTSSFGNARFVKRLLTTQILPRMASRLAQQCTSVPSLQELTTIIGEDMPITKEEASRIENRSFDEALLSEALEELDAMVGLRQVKCALHNFIDIMRHLSQDGNFTPDASVMQWNFMGNTGTGKSTVARIMAKIFRGMGLLQQGNMVEVKGEEIFNVPEYRCDQVLTDAMTKAKQGVLFIDGDAPIFKNTFSDGLTGEQLRFKLQNLMQKEGSCGAMIMAQCELPQKPIVQSLAKCGVYDFDQTLLFEDYTSEELFQILESCIERHQAKFDEVASAKMRKFIDNLSQNRALGFANARTMKLLSKSILGIMLLRQSREKDAGERVIKGSDVESFEWAKPFRKIGF